MNGNIVILTGKKIIVMSIVTESSTVLLYVSFTVTVSRDNIALTVVRVKECIKIH